MKIPQYTAVTASQTILHQLLLLRFTVRLTLLICDLHEGSKFVDVLPFAYNFNRTISYDGSRFKAAAPAKSEAKRPKRRAEVIWSIRKMNFHCYCGAFVVFVSCSMAVMASQWCKACQCFRRFKYNEYWSCNFLKLNNSAFFHFQCAQLRKCS